MSLLSSPHPAYQSETLKLRTYAPFPEEIWQPFAPHIHQKCFKKDESVFHHTDLASHLWLVMRGWVKLIRQTPDGKETIVGLCTAGDMFGEAALFPRAHYPYHAISLEADTEIASISSSMARSLVQNHPRLSQALMTLLNQRVTQAQLKLEQLHTMSAAQRLGCFLLRLCHDQSEGSKQLRIPVEKHILASYLGMKPETWSRSQQQLRQVGVTVSGPEMHIQNIEILRDFVCGSCSESGSCDTGLTDDTTGNI